MSEEIQQGDELTQDELEQQTGEPLPDREAMSVVWIEPEPIPPVADDGTWIPERHANGRLSAAFTREGGSMTDEIQKQDELTQEELEAQGGEALPDREAMSLVDANVAIPINAAVAANVLSDDAIAYADATQDAEIDQSN